MSSFKMWGPCWVIVTGASRGLGAALCEGIAPLLGPGSKLVGVARSQTGLDSTAAVVTRASPDVQFVPVQIDLENASREELENNIFKVLRESHGPAPQCCVIFHNAGSLGDLKYLQDIHDRANITSYFNLNISSVILLNAVFLEAMSKYPDISVKVVNISSLCAVQPFKSWGLYCTGKAARDMAFKVLAAENPKLRVLNYAPGPLDGEMQKKARSETSDEEMRSAFQSMKDENKLLPFSVSVTKLMDILAKDQFKSGAHVDYYDE